MRRDSLLSRPGSCPADGVHLIHPGRTLAGGTSVFGLKLATWRANPRTSVNRNAQDACRSGGSVAHSIASFVVMVSALRFPMKATKSPSRWV